MNPLEHRVPLAPFMAALGLDNTVESSLELELMLGFSHGATKSAIQRGFLNVYQASDWCDIVRLNPHEIWDEYAQMVIDIEDRAKEATRAANRRYKQAKRAERIETQEGMVA